jgi:hypothetical protein
MQHISDGAYNIVKHNINSYRMENIGKIKKIIHSNTLIVLTATPLILALLISRLHRYGRRVSAEPDTNT